MTRRLPRGTVRSTTLRSTALPLLLTFAALGAGLAGCGRDAADSAVADSAAVAGDAAAAAAALPTVRAGALVVSDLVAPAPAGDAPMALYFTVANEGGAADTLLGIAADDVRAASLHATVGGRMTSVAWLALPPAGRLTLRPGGVHAMLEGRARPFAPGDTLRATLRFAAAGPVRVAAPVVAYADLERRLVDAPAPDAAPAGGTR